MEQARRAAEFARGGGDGEETGWLGAQEFRSYFAELAGHFVDDSAEVETRL